jgi:hypothetical protein
MSARRTRRVRTMVISLFVTVGVILFVTVGIILFCFAVVKIIAMLNAIVYIVRAGRQHVDNLLLRQSQLGGAALTQCDFFESFEKTGGNFWPFGMKDYKLRKLALAGRRKLTGIIVLFSYPVLPGIISLYVVLASVVSHYIFDLGAAFNIFIYSLALLALTMNLPIAVEHAVGPNLIGNYAEKIHMTGTFDDSSVKVISAFKVLIAIMLDILSTGTAAVFSTLLLVHGIKPPEEININELDVLSLIKLIIYCLYFTMTTLSTVGYGDVYPMNTYGRVIIITLLSLCFILIGFVITVWSRGVVEID